MCQIVLLFFVFVIPFVTTFFIFPAGIATFKRANIVGKDMHKAGQPEVAEMGGLVIAAGFSLGIITVIAVNTFLPSLLTINLIQILAAFSVVLIMTLVGSVDDLIGIRQIPKVIIPLLASLPLVAIRAGQTSMNIPLIGHMDFGMIYPLVLVPIAVTGAANAFNMLAGFNGLEVGMGIAATGSLAIVAYSVGATTSFVLLLALAGALLAALRYNWYPSKVFIGDTGAFSIGAVIASAVILGNFEYAGVIVIIPHALDFLLKAFHKFPSKGWWGTYKDGKLFCPEKVPVSLPQLVMKLCGGISERNLVLTLIGVEVIFGAIAVLMYV